MFDRFKNRSHDLERLDTGDYTEREYVRWQTEMRYIHRVLGELRALKYSLYSEIADRGDTRVSILDVGAGTGNLLKSLMERCPTDTFVAGVELNANAARSMLCNDISAIRADGLCLPFDPNSFDYVYCSLVLHHLNDEEAVRLLREMSRVARKKICVIDLHRKPGAYYIYRILGTLLLQRFTLDDGALSILRSFKPEELIRLGQMAGLKDVTVRRSAAYRLVLTGI